MNDRVLRPAVGVGGVVLDAEGRVLLVRRKHPPQAGLWHIPGGRLEAGETLAECCRREVLEETGIRVTPGPIIAVADRAIEGFHYIIIDFLAELTPDSPRQPFHSSDAADASWVHPQALGAYPLVEGLDAVIRAAKERRLAAGLAAGTDCPWLYVPESPLGAR
ncbi:MAG: NUDIX hydrolase [Methylococcaceae bacterium]|jgi:8-oxo-dGTP diphosphatase|nr:NUDIX hydrolase [Methylococcaceae bacterium]